MKRFTHVVCWSVFLALLFSSPFLVERKSQAKSKVASKQHQKISKDLVKKLESGKGSDSVRVIVQSVAQSDSSLDSTLETAGGSNIKKFRNFGLRVVTLPAKVAAALASRSDVSYVSLDRDVRPLGHVSRTAGANKVRAGSVISPAGLDGTGIGIAVVDSGVDAEHKSFLDSSGVSRVLYSKDFTGEGRTDDPYGHGTHVASLAAGNGRISNGDYIGIAPNANLINLRVLNSQGLGTTAGVLSALDWVASNRQTYNLRVVNLSLGMPAIDSYRDDPICRTVRSLVDSGVVVFAASGNNGKDEQGNKIYGRIHSPGNEPSAITVGATNTFGTDERSDDGVASFSSRGPTRSFYTDDEGVNHYDNLIKPDVVAPGNKLIDAEADDNYLVTQNPSLDAGVSRIENRRMMFLSGSSMATPIAAGAATLMLQA
ncbi:MAG TPA: S8 family peptidase, partial [Pyrinomonadaceae bacterium]